MKIILKRHRNHLIVCSIILNFKYKWVGVITRKYYRPFKKWIYDFTDLFNKLDHSETHNVTDINVHKIFSEIKYKSRRRIFRENCEFEFQRVNFIEVYQIYKLWNEKWLHLYVSTKSNGEWNVDPAWHSWTGICLLQLIYL